MSRINILIGAFVSLLWAPVVTGQPTVKSLKLEDCISIAVENNPSLAQAQAEIEVANSRALQAGLKPNPIIGYRGSQMNRAGRAGEHGIFLQHQFILSKKLLFASEMHRREADIGLIAMEIQSKRIATDVALRFYDYLAAQHRTKAYSDRLDRLKSQRAAFKGTIAPRIDILLKMEQMKTEADVQAALKTEFRVKRSLASAMGLRQLPGAIDGELNSFPPVLTWDETLDMVLSRSPEVAIVEARFCRENAKVQVECEKRKPDIYASMAVQYDELYNRPQVTLQVGIPIGVHNKNQGNINAARANVTRAVAERARVSRSIQERLACAYEGYQVAHARVDAYTKYVNEVVRVYESYKNGFHTAPVGRKYPYSHVIDPDRLVLSSTLEKIRVEQQRAKYASIIAGDLLVNSFEESPVLQKGIGMTPIIADQALPPLN